jgi:hypothetical protein
MCQKVILIPTAPFSIFLRDGVAGLGTSQSSKTVAGALKGSSVSWFHLRYDCVHSTSHTM